MGICAKLNHIQQQNFIVDGLLHVQMKENHNRTELMKDKELDCANDLYKMQKPECSPGFNKSKFRTATAPKRSQ